MGLRIGFKTSPQNVDWATLEEAWAEGGRHDVFDSAWLNDHITDPGRDRGGPSFEALTALAALARHVPGKDVGHAVLSATFRHPSMLAKEAITLDHVTDGRFILGLGAGWHVGEHEALGIDLPPLRERFDRFEATVQLLKALFSERAVSDPGVTLDAPPFRLAGATMEPGPVRPGGPPVWLGGQGPRGLRIAARLADGWNYAANLRGTREGFRERREWLFRACDEVGRDPAELTLSVQLIVGADAQGRRQTVDEAAGYVAEGASVVILTTLARWGAEGIRTVAAEVAAPLKDAAA